MENKDEYALQVGSNKSTLSGWEKSSNDHKTP